MKDWTEYEAKDVMKRPVRTIESGTSLKEAISILNEEEISGTPVVDAEGRAIGVLSLFDVIQYLSGLDRELLRTGTYYSFVDPDAEEAAAGWQKIRDIGDRDLLVSTVVDDAMTPSVIGVAGDTPLPDVVRMMRDRHIHRVLVLDGDEPVGVVSTMDVLAALPVTGRARGGIARAKAH